jgi:RNA polymerase sigma-70 factor (ECF subfamily)
MSLRVGIKRSAGKPLAPETEEVWKKFNNLLKQFILKRVRNEHDAEDILQDVFCKIHNSIHKLKDKDKLQAWVYQITRHTIIDYYRSRKVMAEPTEIPEDLVNEPIPSTLNEDIAACLKPMMDDLPEKYRESIILTEVAGLTQKEMAEKLGLSLSGAKSRVQRGREKLKEVLLACCHFELDRLGNILDYQLKEQSCRYCQGRSTGE